MPKKYKLTKVKGENCCNEDVMFKKIEAVFNNRYNVIKELGRGGMSVVYLAVSNDQLQQYRAIKIVKYEMIAGDSVLHEARILKDLEHDGIPRIVEISNDTAAKQLYLVQEYVAGKNLKHVRTLSDGISEVILLNWFKYLAILLSYIHDKGVIHGDIKPENIMFTKEGKLKLIDFGISFSEQHKAKRAYSNYYASPEQAAGREVDVRSELYSLAMTMYAVFVGNELLLNTKDRKKPSKQELDATFKMNGLSSVFNKCVAEKPEKRYQDMHELLADLNCIESEKNIKQHFSFTKSLQLWLAMALVFLGLIFTMGGLSRMSIDREITYKNELQKIQDFIEVGKTNEALIILSTLDPEVQDRQKVKLLNVRLLYENADFNNCVDYIKGLKIDGASIDNEIIYYYAKSFYYLSDYEQAAKHFKELYLLNKIDQSINCNYLISLIQADKLGVAEKLVADQRGSVAEQLLNTISDAELALLNKKNDLAIKKYRQAIEDIDDNELAFDISLRIADIYAESENRQNLLDKATIEYLESVTKRFENGRKKYLLQEALANIYQLEAKHGDDKKKIQENYKKAIDLYEELLSVQPKREGAFNKLANLYRQRSEYDELNRLIVRFDDDFSDLVFYRIQVLLFMLDQQALNDKKARDYSAFEKSYRSFLNEFEKVDDSSEYHQLNKRIKALVKAGFIDDAILSER